MELENRTPVVARIDVGAPLPNGLRRGIVTAKATYRYDASGALTLETQSPDPVRLRDEATPFGTLPCDVVPRIDEAFEVALLGSAHAPAGDKVAAMRVALAVGDKRRELAVFGDRMWDGEGEGAAISRPAPFTSMPLTWARAFGGTVDVLVDDESPVEVMHMANPAGRGFDPAPHARGLDEQLTCPPGYPTWERRRPLPNVERPDALVRAWGDAPDPAGWSPVHPATDMHMRRAVRMPADVATRPVGEGVEVLAGMHHRAHPDWVFERAPAPGTPVRLEGLDPAGAISFALPALAVWLDYQLGARTGARQLALHALTIFNDARRFTLTYRLPFQLELPKGEARQARLRVEGWQ